MPSNTYLVEFNLATLPSSIKAGYCNIKVEMYIPNPLRCYKCQKFGHGSRSCRGKLICQTCGEEDHESTDCKTEPKCVNCQGSHPASSKQCPCYVRESKILRVKYENNISFTKPAKRFLKVNVLRMQQSLHLHSLNLKVQFNLSRSLARLIICGWKTPIQHK